LKNKRIWAIGLALVVLMGIGVVNTGCANAVPTAPSPTPAAFSVSNLHIEPSEAKAGEEVTVSAEVSNTGSGEGGYTAELRVNGVTEKSQNLTIPAGASLGVTFSVSKDTPGVYAVALGDLTGQFVVTGPAAVALRSATWSEAAVTLLFFKEIPELRVRILPKNEAVIEGALVPITVSIGVSEGKIYFGGVYSAAYDYIAGGHDVIKTYTKYDGDKLWLTSLPPWVDPGKEFAPDVDKLPFVESISTKKGEASLTYRWP
jgi:uncharacterized protein (DUF58 family)